MSTEKKPTFYKKLIKARKAMKHPSRGGKNKYKNHDYATLQDLYDSCLEPLLNEGLFVFHKEEAGEDGTRYLVTKIVCEDTEECCEASSKLDTSLDIQSYGGQYTYLKKYHLSGLLCLRTDTDDDGEALQQAQRETISHAEAEELKKRINGNKTVWNNISRTYDLKSISSIPRHKYKEIVTHLDRALINVKKEENGNDSII
jgi:hypothetical protein